MLEKNTGNEGKYFEKYEHPIWKNYQKEDVREGHGGMDRPVINVFFDVL